MKTNEIRIFVDEYEGLDELSEMDQQLILEARKIARTAYAPYSHFRVGASVLLTNGQVISGNNQENSAYPSGLCAERVAMFYANANYPNEKIAAIAISALKNGDMVDDPVRPCGSCRQALLEAEVRFKQPIRIILDGKNKIQVLQGIESLLPLSFSRSFL
jgi:cytidine deaminase